MDYLLNFCKRAAILFFVAIHNIICGMDKKITVVCGGIYFRLVYFNVVFRGIVVNREMMRKHAMTIV